MNLDVFDITIIGGGPVGLFAAYYAGLRSARTKIIDALPELGGQLTALYPEKFIYDVAGFPKVLARDLVDMMVEQATEQYHPEVCLDQKVVDIRRDGHFVLTTEKGEVHHTRTVIIAAGVGAFMPKRLDVPNLQELEGRGVHYFVRDKSGLADKRILVVGGGDSAVDWVLNLHDVAREIALIHRRDVFRAHEDSVAKMRSLPMEIKLFWELKAVHGTERVEAVTMFNNQTGDEETREIDALLCNVGFLANLGPIKQWGLEIAQNSIKVDYKMETNIPGIFAAGDIVDFPGKLKLIATGAGEAAIAVNFAKHSIDPTARIFPGHSSDRKE